MEDETLIGLLHDTPKKHTLYLNVADAFIQSMHTMHSGYTFIVSMCVPWELNPRPLRCLRNALPLSRRNTKIIKRIGITILDYALGTPTVFPVVKQEKVDSNTPCALDHVLRSLK